MSACNCCDDPIYYYGGGSFPEFLPYVQIVNEWRSVNAPAGCGNTTNYNGSNPEGIYHTKVYYPYFYFPLSISGTVTRTYARDENGDCQYTDDNTHDIPNWYFYVNWSAVTSDTPDDPEEAEGVAVARLNEEEWKSGFENRVISYRQNLPTTISLRESRWQVSVRFPISCYVKIWLRIVTEELSDTFAQTPVSSSEEIETREYTGSQVCKGPPYMQTIDNPYYYYYYYGNYSPIYPIDFRITEPESLPVPETNIIFANIRKTIYLQKYSFLQGYEPDFNDPLKFNGFPNY